MCKSTKKVVPKAVKLSVSLKSPSDAFSVISVAGGKKTMSPLQSDDERSEDSRFLTRLLIKSGVSSDENEMIDFAVVAAGKRIKNIHLHYYKGESCHYKLLTESWGKSVIHKCCIIVFQSELFMCYLANINHHIYCYKPNFN